MTALPLVAPQTIDLLAEPLWTFSSRAGSASIAIANVYRQTSATRSGSLNVATLMAQRAQRGGKQDRAYTSGVHRCFPLISHRWLIMAGH